MALHVNDWGISRGEDDPALHPQPVAEVSFLEIEKKVLVNVLTRQESAERVHEAPRQVEACVRNDDGSSVRQHQDIQRLRVSQPC